MTAGTVSENNGDARPPLSDDERTVCAVGRSFDATEKNVNAFSDIFRGDHQPHDDVEVVPVEMLRDLSLNPGLLDPDDNISVIALCGEDDGEDDVLDVDILQRDIATVDAWISAEESSSAKRRELLRKMRNDIEMATNGDTAEMNDLQTLDVEKTRSLALAHLRSRKLTADLEAARAREAHKIAEESSESMQDSRHADDADVNARRTEELQQEIERVQLYVQVVNASKNNGKHFHTDPERRHYFYADCHVGGLGKWFIQCLAERPNWHPYPAQRWFNNPQDGTALFAPVGKVTVDFTDQPSFSLCTDGCPGSDWLEDKSRLARLIVPLGLMVPTWFIRDRKWVGEVPGGYSGDDSRNSAIDNSGTADSNTSNTNNLFGQTIKNKVWPDVWFVKEANLNFGVGVSVCQSPEACLQFVKSNKGTENRTYVVQPSVANSRTDQRGHKLGWRLYIACVSPPNSKKLNWFMFRGGYLVAADGELERHVLDPLGHCTKDRVMTFNDWDDFELYEPVMREMITEMLKKAQPKMKPPTGKGCFELFGVDLIVGEDDLGDTSKGSKEGSKEGSEFKRNTVTDEHVACTAPTPSNVFIVEVNRSPRVKIDDKKMLHSLLNIAVPRYGLPQGPEDVWDLLDVDPDECDTWHPDTEEESHELKTWGRKRWDTQGGIDGEQPLPSAFGGDQSWGARAE
mgnify:FL=1|tara:strand:- start:27910 stop:29964 length:2055 start_codon:yes stop_codon:yes gene_type:complete